MGEAGGRGGLNTTVLMEAPQKQKSLELCCSLCDVDVTTVHAELSWAVATQEVEAVNARSCE